MILDFDWDGGGMSKTKMSNKNVKNIKQVHINDNGYYERHFTLTAYSLDYSF